MQPLYNSIFVIEKSDHPEATPSNAPDTLQQAHAGMVESGIQDPSIDQHGDKFILRGRCSRFFHKQRAQETVRALMSWALITNAIEVTDAR